MTQETAAEAADFMRLFSTPSRVMLLSFIAGKERSVGEIQDQLGFKQPGLSQQLAELRQAGVVRSRRNSRQIYYEIADERVAVVIEMLLRMSTRSPSVAASSPGQRAFASPGVARVLLGEMAQFARLETGG
jgi:DNA-binding transcriptional ArsR family regulator